VCRDVETGQIHAVNARCVINAAGVWVDQFRQLDGEAVGRAASAMVAPSQGVHLVVDASFLPSRHALMVPKTADGRVLFAVPWLGQLVLGTTDTPRSDVVYEPKPLASEVDFILSESARYLTKPPVRADVKSIWVGLRPLVKPPEEDGHATKGISREHTVLVSRSGLVTVTGGKWTTYRAMAEDVLDRCIDAAILPPKVPCQTGSHALVGTGHEILEHVPISAAPGLHLYGEEAAQVESLPGHNVMLAMGLSEAMVRFAVRQEHARTVEDVLARRSRLLFLDAALAEKVADRVSEILQEEGIVAPQLDAFVALAHQYRTLPV
jgi:glycerol-3-phosphate dehydrogenase